MHHMLVRVAGQHALCKPNEIAELKQTQAEPCGICKQRVQGELVCLVCGLHMHDACVADQFAEVEGVCEERPAVFFCHACFMERASEVDVACFVLDPKVQLCLVRVCEELLDAQTQGYYVTYGEPQAAKRFYMKKTVEVVRASPFAKKASRAAKGATMDCARPATVSTHPPSAAAAQPPETSRAGRERARAQGPVLQPAQDARAEWLAQHLADLQLGSAEAADMESSARPMTRAEVFKLVQTLMPSGNRAGAWGVLQHDHHTGTGAAGRCVSRGGHRQVHARAHRA